jgi:hypothetical protein
VAMLATYLYPLPKMTWTSCFLCIGILEAEKAELVALTATRGMVEWEAMAVAVSPGVSLHSERTQSNISCKD